MDRLGFTLPDFCRVGWASEAARQRWAPVIEQIGRLWQTLEVESVRIAMRRVGLVPLGHGCAHEIFGGLESAPLYRFSPRSMYVSERKSTIDGGDVTVHAVGTKRDVEDAVHAFTRQQDDVLGRLLGYPECCIRFFQEVWIGQRHIDTTWPMALGSMPDGTPEVREFEAASTPHTNMLLRWLGVRPVFHLPCSFQCAETWRVAEEIKALAIRIGQHDVIESLYDMLRWPVQWSALHGIAEVETPVLRISARTDATSTEYKVRLLGAAGEIDAAPSGTRFPYRSPGRAASRQAVIEPPRRRAERVLTSAPWFHLDNGFRSPAEMHRSLTPLVLAVAARTPREVLHISCKNGALLRRLMDTLPEVTVHGVDPDPKKIEHARLLMPTQARHFNVGHVSSGLSGSSWPEVDVCLLMLGRLLELPREPALAALQPIRERARIVLVYAFDDWLRRGTLDEMAASLGLFLSRPFDELASVAQLI